MIGKANQRIKTMKALYDNIQAEIFGAFRGLDAHNSRLERLESKGVREGRKKPGPKPGSKRKKKNPPDTVPEG